MRAAATDASNPVILGMVDEQCWTCFVLRSLEGNVKSIVVLVHVIYRHKRKQYVPDYAEGLLLSVPTVLIKTEKWVGEMAQQEKVRAAKPNDLSSSPWAYMAGESWLLQVVL